MTGYACPVCGTRWRPGFVVWVPDGYCACVYESWDDADDDLGCGHLAVEVDA